MTRLETDVLADLFRQKHDLLVQLRDLGRRQLEFIAAGDMTQLLRVLAGKQHLLAAMQQLERQFDPFRPQAPESRQWRSAEDRQRCADHAARCRSLLAEIVQQEKQSETDLTLRRDEVATRLHGFHNAAQARGAYDSQPRSSVRQLDLTSES